jgi:thiol-disulfide isomerase/thioredoxin
MHSQHKGFGDLVQRHAAAGMLALLAAMSAPAMGDIVREGEGTRRQELSAMELKDAPGDVWATLSQWSADGKPGEALSAAKIDGKPVLILTWASWSKPSTREALPLAQKMADQFGAQGLIVVAAHGSQGWDGAAGIVKDRGVKIHIALDEKGDFRKALKSDADPDFYVIDRAGHMRYADIANASVEEAVAEVVKETKEQAADVPSILKKRESDQSMAAAQTSAITDLDIEKLPLVPPMYRQPGEREYENVAWPKIEPERAQEWGFSDSRGNIEYPALTYSPVSEVKTGRHARDGRVTVIYLWAPGIERSFSVMEDMDRLQQSNLRDLYVVGVATMDARLDGRGTWTADEDQDRLLKEFRDRYETIVKKRNFKHTMAFDPEASVWGSLGEDNRSFPIPGAMLVSSDGVIRWMGWINSPDFKSAVDKMIRVDPGVQIRREADRMLIQDGRR